MVRGLPDGLTISESRTEDCFDIAPRLRLIDQTETRKLSQVEPLDALLYGVHAGECFTVFRNDRPIGMYGVVRHDSYAVPWLVGTHSLSDYFISMTREARAYLSRWDRWVLMNKMLASNTVHRRWAEYLGFRVSHTYTVNNEEAVLYVRPNRRDCDGNGSQCGEPSCQSGGEG